MNTDTMAYGNNLIEARERYDKIQDTQEQLEKFERSLGGHSVLIYGTEVERAIMKSLQALRVLVNREEDEARKYKFFYESVVLSDEYQSHKLAKEADAWVKQENK